MDWNDMMDFFITNFLYHVIKIHNFIRMNWRNKTKARANYNNIGIIIFGRQSRYSIERDFVHNEYGTVSTKHIYAAYWKFSNESEKNVKKAFFHHFPRTDISVMLKRCNSFANLAILAYFWTFSTSRRNQFLSGYSKLTVEFSVFIFEGNTLFSKEYQKNLIFRLF